MHRRPLAVLLGVLLVVSGALIAIYGLFALLYRESGGGSTYVTFFGREIDAHLVGALALVVGLVLVVAPPIVRRSSRHRSFSKPS
jgi:hypothetical protein